MNQSNRMSKPFWRRISLIEWGVAGLITLASVYLHWICSRSAGALWRDETGIVNIAQLHSWQEVWNALPHDHCPVIFPLLVRAWSEAGLGATDYGLRILGLGIGLGLLTAIWISLRLMGRGLPLFTVALVSMNSTVIIFGDSLRAYGLATVFILLTLGLVWHFLERPNWQRGLLAAITAMASVQTLYQNAFLVLAICVAGIALSVQRRQYRTALAMMGIGLVSALSLLPYVHAMIEAQSWWALSKPREGVGAFIAQLIQISGGADHTWFLFVWFISVIMAATLGAGHFLVINQETAVQRNDVCFFAGMALVAGFAGYGSFFMLSGLTVQPWYCIPLFGFIAVCCDVILPRIHPVTRLGVLLVAILSPLLAYPVVHTQVQQPRTNGYLVAEKLSRHIIPGDLIIVYPWYYGITFARYYHGGLPWETLPPLGDYRFHRYDLLKTKLQMTNAIQSVLEETEAKLRSGHRVWIVGEVPFPKPTATPPVDLPPAPNGTMGWFDAPYTQVWGAQLGYLLSHHVTNHISIVSPSTPDTKLMEHIGLTFLSGWTDSSPTNLIRSQ
jgi:hypothetical protein